MVLSRRKMLGGLVGLGGLVVAAANSLHEVPDGKNDILAGLPGEKKRFEQQGGDFSWKPRKLDLDEVARVAHAGFHYQGYG